MKFSIKDFFSKCDQIWSILRICSHLLKKSLMGNFIFCAVVFKEFTLLVSQFWYSFSNEKQLVLDLLYNCVFLSCHIHRLSESTICNYLNVKELLAQNRRDIWNLNDWNETQNHNHFFCKRSLKPLNKLLLDLADCKVFVYELNDCGFKSCCSHLSNNTSFK